MSPSEEAACLRVKSAAIAIGASEAALFAVGDSSSLRTVMHLRPDAATKEELAAAENAFKEIARECLDQRKDGVIDVDDGTEKADRQFCLVQLGRIKEKVTWVAAYIRRSESHERAHLVLNELRSHRVFN